MSKSRIPPQAPTRGMDIGEPQRTHVIVPRELPALLPQIPDEPRREPLPAREPAFEPAAA